MHRLCAGIQRGVRAYSHLITSHAKRNYSSPKYYKVMTEDEKHYNFQYKDGLNVLRGRFNNNPNASCGPGGLYFTNTNNILKYLSYGTHVREITLPWGNPKFRYVADSDKCRANMLILGKKHDLSKVETIRMLTKQGTFIYETDDHVMKFYAERGNLEIIKFLVRKGADIHANDDYALRCSAANGYLEVVKYLVKKGAKVDAEFNYALRWAARNGHLDIVKYLIKKGADIHANDDYALVMSARNGHLKTVKYLIKKGANVLAENGYALKVSEIFGHTEIHQLLKRHSIRTK